MWVVKKEEEEEEEEEEGGKVCYFFPIVKVDVSVLWTSARV